MIVRNRVKVFTEVEFRDELPKSFVGKALRRLLVEDDKEVLHSR